MSHGGQSVRFPFAWARLLAALMGGPLAVAHAADSDDRRAVVDYTLWFSDVYVRTPAGWRYLFGQASLPVCSNGRCEK